MIINTKDTGGHWPLPEAQALVNFPTTTDFSWEVATLIFIASPPPIPGDEIVKACINKIGVKAF